ncbi:MAG: DUF6221 family protein [Actinomycetota bacterium]|nr:DUF6221 family protein [Actinomycetota bacterium]
MNDLAGFILARVSEDEAVARAVLDSGVHDERSAVKEWIAVANPQRMLTWSDARRRIVALHHAAERLLAEDNRPELCLGCGHPEPCPTMRLMALVWADHPDYRQSWRP